MFDMCVKVKFVYEVCVYQSCFTFLFNFRFSNSYYYFKTFPLVLTTLAFALLLI